MPYRTIHWVKLEKRLLNDHRFYLMSKDAQLIYLKLLMLAAETQNKIPKDPEILGTCLRSDLNPEQLKNIIEEIKTNFPKFKQNGNIYKFLEWSKRHHWVEPQESPGSSQGTPKELVDKNKIKNKIRIIYYYIRLKNFNPDNDKDVNKLLITRNLRVAERLRVLSRNDPGKVESAMKWLADICDKKGFSWTLETLERWLPEYMARGADMGAEALRKEFGLK